MNASTLVKCPIRYGRKSTSRGDSYTMVFSPDLETNQYGRAQVVPCLHDSFNLGGILDAAVELWAAETKNNPDRTKRRVSSKWGCVALLPNEKRMGDLAGILRAWEDLVSKESTYKSFRKNKDESKAHVSPNGRLQIPWPNDIYDTPVKFDLLLATANLPDQEYSEPQVIADAWCKGEGKSFVDYFRNNQYFNIRTFQDDLIEERINER